MNVDKPNQGVIANLMRRAGMADPHARRLLLLVIVHLNVLFCLPLLSRFRDGSSWSIVLSQMCWLFAEAALLGLWAGLSSARWRTRALGVAAGITLFQLSTFSPAFRWQGMWDGRLTLELAILETTLIAGLAWLAHRILIRTPDDAATRFHLQFRLVDLMGATFIFGTLLGMMKWLTPFFDELSRQEVVAFFTFFGFVVVTSPILGLLVFCCDSRRLRGVLTMLTFVVPATIQAYFLDGVYTTATLWIEIVVLVTLVIARSILTAEIHRADDTTCSQWAIAI